MSSSPRFRATFRVQNVSKSFFAGADNCTAGVVALDGASVEIRGGEALLVCGPLGAGKTTLLLCAAGLLHFDSGEVVRGVRRVVYRDLAHPAPNIHDWPSAGVILLDSCDAVGEPMTTRVAEAIEVALRRGSALVIAARDPESALGLIPDAATVSVVHLRRGRTAGDREQIAPVHRVAEGAGGGY